MNRRKLTSTFHGGGGYSTLAVGGKTAGSKPMFSSKNHGHHVSANFNQESRDYENLSSGINGIGLIGKN